jgi:hypothetical protein
LPVTNTQFPKTPNSSANIPSNIEVEAEYTDHYALRVTQIMERYYKFLPILFTALTFVMISSIIHGFSSNVQNDIDESATFLSLKREHFHHSIYICLGILIPISVDHLLTLSTLWSPDMFIHIESYIIPLSTITLQSFNIYLLAADSNLEYFWAYHNIANYQYCILCNAIFVIQIYSVHKCLNMLNTSMYAMYLFNLSLILKLLVSLYHAPWLIALWALCFIALIAACGAIVWTWYHMYQQAMKTGLQDQSSMYSFFEMLLLTAFIVSTQFIT